MRTLSVPRIAPALILTLGCLACDDSDEITGSNPGLVRVSVIAPDTVRTGDAFELRIELENVGRANIRNARVDVTYPPAAYFDEEGTWSSSLTRSVSYGESGFSWMVADFGPNGRPFLRFSTVYLYLSPGQGSTTITFEATLIGATYGGPDVVARKDITVNP